LGGVGREGGVAGLLPAAADAQQAQRAVNASNRTACVRGLEASAVGEEKKGGLKYFYPMGWIFK